MGFVESGTADDAEKEVDSSAKMEDVCLLPAGLGWVVEINRLLAVKADAVESAVTATAMGNRLPIMFFNDRSKAVSALSCRVSRVIDASSPLGLGVGWVVSWPLRTSHGESSTRRQRWEWKKIIVL